MPARVGHGPETGHDRPLGWHLHHGAEEERILSTAARTTRTGGKTQSRPDAVPAHRGTTAKCAGLQGRPSGMSGCVYWSSEVSVVNKLDVQRAALQQMRDMLRRFIRGDLEVDAFVPSYGAATATGRPGQRP